MARTKLSEAKKRKIKVEESEEVLTLECVTRRGGV